MNPRLTFNVVVVCALAGAATARAQAPELGRGELLADLSALSHDSLGGRAPGTPGSRMARAILIAGLERAGAQPIGGSWQHPFEWDGGKGVNVLGRIQGSERPDGVIVLSAHYDHLGTRGGRIFNGADDNASGSAAVLAIARVLGRTPLRHTVVLALFDAEEEGLRGAKAFVADPPVPLDQVVLDVNLDMVARTGGLLWASGTYQNPELRPTLERVAAHAPLTLRLGHDHPGAPEGDDWTDQSDQGPFNDAGVPFVYFGVEDHPDYHRPTDDFENVDPDEYVASVTTILSALRALDGELR